MDSIFGGAVMRCSSIGSVGRLTTVAFNAADTHERLWKSATKFSTKVEYV